MSNSSVSIVSGRSSVYIAEKIAESFGIPLAKTTVTDFSDGEFQPSFEENLRGKSVYIVQSTFPPSDNLMELLMFIDAAKRASAKNIIAVIPYYGFARQDRKDKPRVSIAAKLCANLLMAAGANRIMTIDLHADQLQGFFDVPVDHLYASSVFTPYLKTLDLSNLTMASPDAGGTRRAAAYAKHLGLDVVMCYKQRSKPNEIAKMTIIGDVRGKDVVLVDDIIDTAGTICKAAELMLENGAKSVRAIATHPVFSGKAIERLEASAFTEVVVTDSIPVRQECSKVKVLSCAPLFADVMTRVENNESISSLFKF